MREGRKEESGCLSSAFNPRKWLRVPPPTPHPPAPGADSACGGGDRGLGDSRRRR